MTLVDSDTGEVISTMTPDEARQVTDTIRSNLEETWSLLLDAHERQAWKALGYHTWADYISTEFDMSRSHSYRMLHHGRVVRELNEAAGVPNSGHVPVKPYDSERLTTEDASKVAAAVAEAITPEMSEEERTEVIQTKVTERIKSKLTADEVLEKYPDIGGPPGVLTDAEKSSLAQDVVDQAADDPTLDPEDLASSASVEWRKKGREIRRRADQLVAEIDMRAGLAKAVAADDIVAIRLSESLGAAIDRATAFLKELNHA